MANPRQRRKARSGSHKAVRHSNNAKKNLKKQPRQSSICILLCQRNYVELVSLYLAVAIRGPKVLQDAWDKHKTVRQKYVNSVHPSP